MTPLVGGISKHWWSRDGQRILFELTDSGLAALYEVPAKGGQVRKLTQGTDTLYGFSFDRERIQATCVRENSKTPPEVAVLNLPEGKPRTLTALNPELRNVSLGDVSLVRWRNQTINDGNGYLILPLNYVRNRRYPLLIILYGFNGQFISQAQWNPNYPAQVFAAQGYAVLLWNPPNSCPGYPGYHLGDFEEASLAEAYGPLESIQNAVKSVEEMAIADHNHAFRNFSSGVFRGWRSLH